MLVSLGGTTTWQLRKSGLCKFVQNISKNVWSSGKCTDLKFGEVSYMYSFISYNIIISWLYTQNGFRINFKAKQSWTWPWWYQDYRLLFPQKGWEFPGGGGGGGCSVRAKNLEKCRKLNWNFQRCGGGVLEQFSSMGEVWIFSGITQRSKRWLFFEAWHSIHELNALNEHIYISHIYKVLGYPKWHFPTALLEHSFTFVSHLFWRTL